VAETFDDSAGNEGFPGSPYPAIWAHDHADDTLYSEEINVVSPDTGPLKWVGGLYFQSDTIHIGPYGFDFGSGTGQAGTPPSVLLSLLAKLPRKTEAVFGQVTYDLTDKLQIAIGGRYTWVQERLTDAEFLYSGGVPFFVIPGNNSISDSKPTGKIAVNYKINDDNMIYAFAATGHKAGGVNTSPMFPATTQPVFGPEDVTNYEVGWKGRLFDGHLRAQLDAYYNDYRNFQLTLFFPAIATSEVANVGGHTTIDGVEFQTQAVFGDFSFDANASYLHSAIGHYVASDPCPNAVIGANPLCSGAPIDVTGKQQVYAPEWTFNLGAQYRFRLASGATITPRVDYSYTSPQWGTVFELPADRLTERNLVNAQLAYSQGRYAITAYATNLFNLIYIDSATEGGIRYPGPPRQFGVRVGMSF
jgi:iron complex outermembrane receptor protein